MSFGSSVKSLTSSSLKNVPEKPYLSEVVILFQPQCSACFQQVKQLSCLNPSLKVRVMGAFANEKTLHSEYMKKYSEFEGVQASQNFLNKYSVEYGLAPQVLVMRDNRYKLLKGLQSCQAIRNAISTLSKKNGKAL